MSNVLAELFEKIANGIRDILGDIGKIKPYDFPDKLHEVAGMVGNGIGGDTSEVDDILDEINGEVVGEKLFTVTFASYDGSEIYETIQVVENDSCPDPVTTNIFVKPTRESTVEHDFSFAGWSKEPEGSRDYGALSKITEDITLYAVYTSTVRSYTITFYDGTTILSNQTLKYGSTPSISDPEKYGYLFDTWEPAITTVTGDATYYAQWIQGSFSAASWAEIAQICAEGKAKEFFAVGDEKVDSFGGANVVMRIAGINHDTLYGALGTASLSIVLSTVVNSEYTYNETNSSSEYVYWPDSGLRSAITALEDALPEDLKSVIAPVYKDYNKAVQGSSGSYYQTHDRLWALSCCEIGLLSSGPGKKYELFELGETKPLTKYGTQANVSYWLRDQFSYNAWYCVNENGELNSRSKGETAYLHFGFCIK